MVSNEVSVGSVTLQPTSNTPQTVDTLYLVRCEQDLHENETNIKLQYRGERERGERGRGERGRGERGRGERGRGERGGKERG